MRAESGHRDTGRTAEPRDEVAHQRGHFRWGRKRMPSGIGQYIAPLIGIASGDLGLRAKHDQAMQIANVHFRQRRRVPGDVADISDRLVMIDRLQVVA